MVESRYSIPQPVSAPVLSLFCGCGGLDLGFERVGFTPLLALDKNPVAVTTYNANRRGRGETARCADLSITSSSDVLKLWRAVAGASVNPVGVIGGPPCQAFSVSNVSGKANDPRAELPSAYARILKGLNEEIGLGFFVFENVPGLKNGKHAETLQGFLSEFRTAGFDIHEFVLNAADYGVPQCRRRLFIIGFNHELFAGIRYSFPHGEHAYVTVRDAIAGLPEPLYYSHDYNPKNNNVHPNHWCMRPRSPRFSDGSLRQGEMLGRSLRVLRWDRPSWTVAYGHREVHVHPSGRRRLSVYEAMLLQGFPKTYELIGTLCDQIRLVSDAVPPPLAYAVAGSIALALGQPQ